VTIAPQPRMGALVSVADVAVQAEWCCNAALARKPPTLCRRTACEVCNAGYQKMRRQLRTANAQLGGMLMANVSPPGKRPRWRITMAALNRLNAQWFVRAEGVEEDVRELAREVTETEDLTELAHADIGQLRREVEAMRERMAAQDVELADLRDAVTALLRGRAA